MSRAGLLERRDQQRDQQRVKHQPRRRLRWVASLQGGALSLLSGTLPRSCGLLGAPTTVASCDEAERVAPNAVSNMPLSETIQIKSASHSAAARKEHLALGRYPVLVFRRTIRPPTPLSWVAFQSAIISLVAFQSHSTWPCFSNRPHTSLAPRKKLSRTVPTIPGPPKSARRESSRRHKPPISPAAESSQTQQRHQPTNQANERTNEQTSERTNERTTVK